MRLVPLVALLVAVTPAVAQVPDVARTPIDGAAITSDERTADAAAIRAVDAEQWEDALARALALVQQFGERPAYLARLATIYNRLHRPADEVAQWERFMTVAPRPSQACPALGKAYRGLGQYEEAISAFTRCLASDPESALLVYYLGLGYEWAGDFGQARQTYSRAATMAPPGYEPRVALARVNLHENALTAARDGAASVLAQVPTHVEAALVAGLAEQRAGRRMEARRYLELAARLSPEYFDVRLALGILEFSEDHVPAARGHFEAAFLADPGRRADVQPWLDRTAPK
jgi:tetratricopeptide (TPR) repeat protein